jgi:single-strand DNA-binding protein
MTPRRFDKATESWVDQPTEWFSVTCWRALADHAAMSLHKGHKVIVTGTFSTRTWTDKDGVERVSNEIDASSVGMDLTRGPVVQKRFERSTTTDVGDKRTDDSNDVAADRLTGEVIPEQSLPDHAAPDEVAA